MWNDVRFALRTLRRSPVFATVAIVSLALGIGANTAIFSLLYQVAVKELPVADPGRVVVLHCDYEAPGWTRTDNNGSTFSFPMYGALRDGNSVFAGMMGRTSTATTLTRSGQSSRAAAEMVTGNFFEVLGVQPAIGRLLTPEDDAHMNPVIVLSYDYWANRMGRDPTALNSQIRMNGHPVTIVGVAPRGFRSVVSGQTPDLYAPVSLMPVAIPGWKRMRQVDAYWLNLFARLKSGVSAAQANAAMTPLFHAVLDDHLRRMSDVTEQKRKEALAKPMTLRPAGQGVNMLREQWQSSLFVMAGMVALVLLIACSNIASLMAVRTAQRQREIAVRAAIGASGGQIARMLLAESGVLAIVGGLLGALISSALTRGLLSLLPEDATGDWLSSQWDIRVFVFSLAVAVLTGALFGLVPALSAARQDPAPAMKSQTSGLTAPEKHARGRLAFVAAQIFISFVLLSGAGLFMKTVSNLMHTDPGFRADRLVTFTLNAQLSGYPPAQSMAIYREVEERLRAQPGIASISYAGFAPFGGAAWGNGVKAPGTKTASNKYVDCLENAVGPGFFRTLGIPLLLGREFDDRDTAKAPKAAVINETFSRFLFESENPIGRVIRTGSNETDLRIVGVAKDSKFGGLREKPQSMLYVPYEQADGDFVHQAAFFFRAAGDERALMGTASAVVKQSAPGVPIERMSSMRAVLDRSAHRQRLIAILACAFAVLAVVLAVVGVYGAAAFSASRRTREFGIRLALGAEPRRLLGLAMREVGAVVAIGVAAGVPAAGVPAAVVLGRVVESQLFGVAASDASTLIVSGAVIAAAVFVAALRPGLRAMRVDPVTALRHE